MATSDGGLRDDVQAELNPADGVPTSEPAPTLPERPSDSAAKSKWIEYLVALGASEAALTGETKHWDDRASDYVSSELSKSELAGLADRLGG